MRKPGIWFAYGLRTSLVLLSSTAAVAAAAPTAARAANPIQIENSLPGTPGWYTGKQPRASGIDGYTSEVSVTPGQSVHLHVTTGISGNRYRVEVFRLGWYNQVGARLLACLPSCSTDEPAVVRPAVPAPDPKTGYLDVRWPVTDVVNVGSTWVSGYHLAKLAVTVGGQGRRGISRSSCERRRRGPRSWCRRGQHMGGLQQLRR